MPTTVKEISIKNAGGTYDTNPVGAEAQYVEVSRDSSGDIIEDITATGVTVSSTEGLAETLKNLEKSVADSNEFSEMTDVDFTSLADKNLVQYDNTTGKWKNIAMDTTPTASSNKPVTSGGIKTALDLKTTDSSLASVAKSGNASDVNYTNTTSGLTATKVQAAIDEVDSKINNIKDNYQSVKLYHNIPRLVPKDVTSYITDGTFYKRLAGTNGFELFEDLYVGDYIKMSRAISAYEQTQTYQTIGSQYVTIAGLDTRMGDGDGGDSVPVINYHHAVMVPGQGFVGTQHFGRSRMNSSNDTTGGYVGSEMFTTTIGAVATSGSTVTTASINQQLYAEFGSHLKTIRQILSNAMDSTRDNRFGNAGGASSGWAWTTVQAVLMSEVEVYGSIVWSSSGYDTGNGNIQLPLFQHNKQAMNNRSAYYWLKDVASGARFCNCSGSGDANYDGVSDAGSYVRPRFILGA